MKVVSARAQRARDFYDELAENSHFSGPFRATIASVVAFAEDRYGIDFDAKETGDAVRGIAAEIVGEE